MKELARKRMLDDEGDVKSLPTRKRGSRVLLGEDLDSKVQSYLRKVRDGGGVVSARIAVAATRGILLSSDRSSLAEFGGPVELTRSWAYSLLEFVKRKATTAKSKIIASNFNELKQSFLDDVVATVVMEDIPPQPILN